MNWLILMPFICNLISPSLPLHPVPEYAVFILLALLKRSTNQRKCLCMKKELDRASWAVFYQKNGIKRTSVIPLRKMFVAINEVTIVNYNFVLLSAVRFLCFCRAFFICNGTFCIK